MHVEDRDREFVARAVDGDPISLQKLLVAQAGDLSRHAASKLPPVLREQIEPGDIVQQTFVEAFRAIRRFRPEKADSFRAWLFGIADNVIKDTVKRQQRAKRGGQWQRVRQLVRTSSCSVADLVELLSAVTHSPSDSAMGHEAVRAVQDAMADLPENYRQAVQLRLLEGKSLEETAEIMARTPRSVQGLIDRAKKHMRAALGRLSNYR